VKTGSRPPRSAVAGPLYCDASALAKLFLPESGSEELNDLLAGRNDVVLSDLAITEVASALARRVREGALALSTARKMHRKVLATVAAGVFSRIELLARSHRDAERLLLSSRSVALRAADALHLALAIDAGAGTILTFDRTMARGALEHGLMVWPEPIS